MIAGPNDEYDWIYATPGHDKSASKDMRADMERFDTYLMGRKTFELVRDRYGAQDAGGAYKGIRNYVFSNTLKDVGKDNTLVTGDVTAAVKRLKRQAGKDIAVFGGGVLASSLLNLGLVDEIVLAIVPVVLGSGKPLFTGIEDRIGLKLMRSKTYSNGVLRLEYATVRPRVKRRTRA